MQHLEWEACYNIRDLGGYLTQRGGQTRTFALLRSDNLCRLTPLGRAALVDYGVRTIVDLRFTDEVKRFPNPFADPAIHNHTLSYHNIPLRARSTVETEAKFKAARSMQEIYCLVLDLGQEAFAQVMNAIADAPEGPVLVHCHAGRDRTGMVIAILLKVAGVPSETIAEDYAASDRYIKPLNDEVLRNLQDSQARERYMHELEITHQTMLGFLAYLDEKYGGAEAYLRAAGVSEDTLEKIKRRLVASNN